MSAPSMDYPSSSPAYARIYALVRMIPPGKVATYGQIASLTGRCSARMAGYALAALSSQEETSPEDAVPWQRVINAQGKISLRADSLGAAFQRQLLEEEGVYFDPGGKVDLRRFRWEGPSPEWLLEHGYEPNPSFREN